MKKMSKEELIEYFIEILGDNKVLEKYFSIDDIRNKLTSIIKEVSYERNEGTTSSGFFDEDIGRVNIDFTKGYTDEQLKETIVHEMLHVLSFSSVDSEKITTNKCGLEISQKAKNGMIKNTGIWTMTKDRTTRMFGKSINEGYTQLLTERILGLDTDENEGYEPEKDFVRILEAAVGKDYLMDTFFEDIEDEECGNMPVEYLVGTRLRELFDMSVQKEVKYNAVDAFCAVIDLLQRITVTRSNVNGDFSEEEQNIFDNDVKELKNKSEQFVETLIYRIKDKTDKERIKNIITALIDEYHAPEFNLHIVDKDVLPIIQDFILEDDELPFSEKLQDYMDITQREEYDSEAGLEDERARRIIEADAIKRGIINDSELYKGTIIALILDNYRESIRGLSDEQIRDLLANFSYIKVGNIYELKYHGIDPNLRGSIDGNIFGADGELLTDRGGFSYYNNSWKYNAGWKSASLSEDEIDRIDIALSRLKNKNGVDFYGAEIYGDNVVVTYISGEKVYYEVSEDGVLVELPEERRRLTDDERDEHIDRTYTSFIDSFPGKENSYTKSVLKYSLKERDMDDINTLINLKLQYEKQKKSASARIVMGHMKTVLENNPARYELIKKVLDYKAKNDELDISKFYYEKIGSYYRFCYIDENQSEDGNILKKYKLNKIFDEDGKQIRSRRLEYLRDKNTFDELDSRRFSVQELDAAKTFNASHGNIYNSLSFSGPMLIAETEEGRDIFVLDEEKGYQKLGDGNLKRIIEEKSMMLEHAISALGIGIREDELEDAREEEVKPKEDTEKKPEFDD